MTTDPPIRVLAWDHPRATLPLAACARQWTERTGVPVLVTTRSLGQFGDEVPDEATADVVLIDHPHIGQAAESGSILPLDDLVQPTQIAHVAAAAIGQSQATYEYLGRTWALAVDASCQALAFHAGAAAGAAVPTTWNEVLALATTLPRRVALPMHPAHAISALLSILASAGFAAGRSELAPAPVLQQSVGLLARLTELSDPACFDWEPPEVLEQLADGVVACVPLVYAYVGYGVEWHPAPAFEVGGAPGSILGGVGAAILAASSNPPRAAAFISWLALAETQSDLIGANGGQPAARDAWLAPSADPMLTGVASTIEVAKARPNAPWWPDFQISAGNLLHAGLLARSDPSELARQVSITYASHWEEAA